jgi:hypothetical protein
LLKAEEILVELWCPGSEDYFALRREHAEKNPLVFLWRGWRDREATRSIVVSSRLALVREIVECEQVLSSIAFPVLDVG